MEGQDGEPTDWTKRSDRDRCIRWDRISRIVREKDAVHSSGDVDIETSRLGEALDNESAWAGYIEYIWFEPTKIEANDDRHKEDLRQFIRDGIKMKEYLVVPDEER